jgi:hypothetical protein
VLGICLCDPGKRLHNGSIGLSFCLFFLQASFTLYSNHLNLISTMLGMTLIARLG